MGIGGYQTLSLYQKELIPPHATKKPPKPYQPPPHPARFFPPKPQFLPTPPPPPPPRIFQNNPLRIPTLTKKTNVTRENQKLTSRCTC